jgi:hypothetical protein
MTHNDDFELFCNGARYTVDDFENQWDIDDLEPELIAGLEACVEINTNLCDTATIVKLHSAGWLIFWWERHPEMVPYDELFAEDGERYPKRTAARLRQWNKFRELLPATLHGKSITRAQAFAAIARVFLPEEFHGDCGLAAR